MRADAREVDVSSLKTMFDADLKSVEEWQAMNITDKDKVKVSICACLIGNQCAVETSRV